jgi:hypothetical protein
MTVYFNIIYTLSQLVVKNKRESISVFNTLKFEINQNTNLMCIGPYIVVINEEEEPPRCYLVFYYTYDRLNMFRAALCPSSGANDYISGYHIDRLILRLLMVGG